MRGKGDGGSSYRSIKELPHSGSAVSCVSLHWHPAWEHCLDLLKANEFLSPQAARRTGHLMSASLHSHGWRSKAQQCNDLARPLPEKASIE